MLITLAVFSGKKNHCWVSSEIVHRAWNHTQSRVTCSALERSDRLRDILAFVLRLRELFELGQKAELANSPSIYEYIVFEILSNTANILSRSAFCHLCYSLSRHSSTFFERKNTFPRKHLMKIILKLSLSPYFSLYLK